MQLTDIIERNARPYFGHVQVDIDHFRGTVAITDLNHNHADIFMQGDDAIDFIDEYETARGEAPAVDDDLVALYVADPYIQALWG